MQHHLTLSHNGTILYSTSLERAIEIGRQEIGEPAAPTLHTFASGRIKLIIAGLSVTSIGRSLARLEPQENGSLKVTNLHARMPLTLRGCALVYPGQDTIVECPMSLDLPDGYSILVRDEQPAMGSNHDTEETEVPSNLFGRRFEPDIEMTLTRMSMPGGSATPSEVPVVLDWLEYALTAMQQPASSKRFFAGIAHAVARIIDVDRAEVVLRNGERWEFDPDRRFVHPRVNPNSIRNPSNSILDQALMTKQLVVYPEANRSIDMLSESIQVLNSAIACPILDVQENGNQILGVLYADRSINTTRRPTTVMDAEKKLITILATAIASSIARTQREQLVTKYQQFFSRKVVDELNRNPGLLQGENVDVTVLFCDIRGFSRISDRIGPESAMMWVSETLSELSSHVLSSDGVLVDYVGDEMFAMWGAPEKSPDHAFRAVMAARAIMRLPKVLSERYRESIPEGVNFGVGLCTGPARVGNTGSKQKFKYGPMGRTVNLGSRIQGLTKQWNATTLMAESTARHLPDDVLRRRLCTATVVGIDGTIDLYELMHDDGPQNQKLVAGYSQALALYESGNQFREAARAFGELVQQYPTDGPSLVMLVRAVKELVEPSDVFTPVWSANAK